MTWGELLNKNELVERFNENNIVWIKGGAHAPLFCSFLLRALTDHTYHIISVRNYTEQELKALLSVSFLGDVLWYVLKDFSEISPVYQKHLSEYLRAYNGPHKIICFNDDVEQGFVLDVSQGINAPLFSRFYHFIHETTIDPGFVRALFSFTKELSVDLAVIMTHYALFLGRRHDVFFSSSWIENIIQPEKSLFTLSQYFFSKDRVNFLTLWSRLSSLYPDEFWISFWAEQLWQADLFLTITDKRDPGIKKSVNRLPFSFIQKDWKQYSHNELMRAYSFLYQIDFRLKNGASSVSLDFFCLKFITSRFA